MVRRSLKRSSSNGSSRRHRFDGIGDLTGCDAEGIAAAMPARRYSARIPSSPATSFRTAMRAGVRAGDASMLLRNSLVIAIAVALPSLALAQTTNQESTAADLDTIVVTGTRTAITVDDSLAAVEVIDREQIERSQARSLPELLRGRAGISLVNQGGLGKLTTLFMRGAESDHTLFLIDGVRVGSATSGLTALQDLPVELIERIEIVRGPRSSLYGSEAIGGVIQVFTRRNRDGVTPHLKLGGGSNGLREANGGIDIGFARGWFGVDYNHQSSDGIHACSGAGFPVFAGCFMDNPDPDRDGYENNAISLRAGAKPTETLTIDAQDRKS